MNTNSVKRPENSSKHIVLSVQYNNPESYISIGIQHLNYGEYPSIHKFPGFSGNKEHVLTAIFRPFLPSPGKGLGTRLRMYKHGLYGSSTK